MTVDADQDIQTEVIGQVIIVRLNRPKQLNAFTREMVANFNDRLDAIAADTSLRAVILTGEGRGFCSGQDVAAADARNRTAPSGVVERMYWQEQFGGMSQRIRAMPQVVVAAVNGPCVGAGMAIALACDVRIIAQESSFHIAAVRLGLTAGESGISYLLPRLIGASRAFEIMLTGRPVDAEEALRVGLAARVVDRDRLLDAAMEWTQSMLKNSPYSTRHTKKVMWENLDASSFGSALDLENRTQILGTLTDDYKEATAAFTDKRPPDFKGE
jgi:enoyl-CoA hydratase